VDFGRGNERFADTRVNRGPPPRCGVAGSSSRASAHAASRFLGAIFFAFFVFLGIATNPAEIVQALIPAALLAIVTRDWALNGVSGLTRRGKFQRGRCGDDFDT